MADEILNEEAQGSEFPTTENVAEQEQIEETPEVQTFRIGETDYDLSTLQELVSKGSDYTRKTQEVAKEREEAKRLLDEARQIAEVHEAWKNPYQRKAIVEHMAKEAGIDLGSTQTGRATNYPSNSPEKWEDWTENERLLWTENQQQKQQLNQLGATLSEVKTYIAKTAEKDKIDAESRLAQQTLKRDHGIDVTSDALKEAVASTGISDPEAAWLKLNAKELARAYQKKGTEQAVTSKPNTPTSRAKTFDPFSDEYSLDDVNRMIAQGYVPTRTVGNWKVGKSGKLEQS